LKKNNIFLNEYKYNKIKKNNNNNNINDENKFEINLIKQNNNIIQNKYNQKNIDESTDKFIKSKIEKVLNFLIFIIKTELNLNIDTNLLIKNIFVFYVEKNKNNDFNFQINKNNLIIKNNSDVIIHNKQEIKNILQASFELMNNVLDCSTKNIEPLPLIEKKNIFDFLDLTMQQMIIIKKHKIINDFELLLINNNNINKNINNNNSNNNNNNNDDKKVIFLKMINTVINEIINSSIDIIFDSILYSISAKKNVFPFFPSHDFAEKKCFDNNNSSEGMKIKFIFK
jgi:hypothetical protein